MVQSIQGIKMESFSGEAEMILGKVEYHVEDITIYQFGIGKIEVLYNPTIFRQSVSLKNCTLNVNGTWGFVLHSKSIGNEQKISDCVESMRKKHPSFSLSDIKLKGIFILDTQPDSDFNFIIDNIRSPFWNLVPLSKMKQSYLNFKKFDLCVKEERDGEFSKECKYVFDYKIEEIIKNVFLNSSTLYFGDSVNNTLLGIHFWTFLTLSITLTCLCPMLSCLAGCCIPFTGCYIYCTFSYLFTTYLFLAAFRGAD